MHGQQNIKICIDFDYLSLAVSNHNSKSMRSITLSRVPCLVLQHFQHYIINDTIFRAEDMEHKIRFIILSTNPLRIVSFPKTNLDYFRN